MFRTICIFFVLVISFLCTSCCMHPAVTRPLPIRDLAQYKNDSPTLKKIIWRASLLSKEHLRYHFGDDNPKQGGMDCSGVLYYILKCMHPHEYIPRDSYEMYIWLAHHHDIHYVSSNDFYSYQFRDLKPGDFLFWEGTYYTHRNPPITHVMLYLGKDWHGKPLMFGSSDSGIYNGEEINGVSVFDFILPDDRGPVRFVAYGCIPGFTCSDSLS